MSRTFKVLAGILYGLVRGLFDSWVQAKNQPREIRFYGARKERLADIVGSIDRQRRNRLVRTRLHSGQPATTEATEAPQRCDDPDGAGEGSSCG